MATISTSAATAPMMANIGVLLLSASPEALAGGKMVGDADGGAVGAVDEEGDPDGDTDGLSVGDDDGVAVGGMLDGEAVGADEDGDPDGDNDGICVGDHDGVEVVGMLDGKAVGAVLDGEAVGANVMRSPLEKQTSTSVVVGTDSLDPQAWVQGESSERKVSP